MATLQEIVQAVDTYIESASGLNISCIKGEPDFRRANIQPPLSALLYAGSGNAAGTIKRVGASATALVVTLQMYASDEVNLFLLAQRLQTMRQRGWIALTAGSGGSAQIVKMRLGDDERIPADPDDPKELRHAVGCPLAIVYE